MTEEQGGNMDIRVSGIGHAENPDETINDEGFEAQYEAVEYSAGAEVDPMEELASEGLDEPVIARASLVSKGWEISDGSPIIEKQNGSKLDNLDIIDPEKIKEDPTPSEGIQKFSETETQNALESSKREGGVVKNKTTGPTMFQRQDKPKLSDSGELLKTPPDMMGDSIMNKYEVTGFEVEYNTGKEMQSVAVREYFDDIETAFSSINGSKFLMPIMDSYKVATIRNGAPRISYNERELYIYKDDKWSRI